MGKLIARPRGQVKHGRAALTVRTDRTGEQLTPDYRAHAAATMRF